MSRKDAEWQALLASTGQPNYLSVNNYEQALRMEREAKILRKSKINDLNVRIALSAKLTEPVKDEINMQAQKLMRTDF